MRHSRTTRLAVFGAAAALTVAACGSDDEPAADSDEESAVTEAPADDGDDAEAAGDAEGADDEDAMEDESGEDDAMEEGDEDAMEEGDDDPMEEGDEDAMEEGGGMEEGAHSVDLANVCPETIVIQTDWFPEAEHGALYQMVGEGYEIDAGNKIVRGPLVSGGGETNVQIEIRTGGPAIGYQQVVSTMAQDDAITFGYVASDEAIENYAEFPTTAFVAPLEINPQIIMWDPETFPDVTSIADLQSAADGEPVIIRYFETGAYMNYLLSSGQVVDSQLDGSYDGSPQVFIAEGGAIAQQGFASAEPYNYENVFEEWGKPVEFELIHDAGWEAYAAPLAVLDSKKDDLTDCMAAFAPVVQQATVDYYADAAATNDLIVEAVNAYEDFWVYDIPLAESSVQVQLDLGLAGNGPDSTVGNFDTDRLAGFIEIAGPVFGVEDAGLTPEDLVTNEFIDDSIGF